MNAVMTTAGLVRGSTATTRGAEVESYLGIPFAAPVAGEGRFLPPRPPELWTGVREATGYGPAVPQNQDAIAVSSSSGSALVTDEAQCLNLNVWTPRADDRGRPVLVWIHGGGYVLGSNSGAQYDGAELAGALDVVVVSVNYRLGALGFLKLDHLLGERYADSANLAVLDWIAALRWVRENIAAFGGDPGLVTVFGESAGGAAVGTLMGTPGAEGLFARAIMQSGTSERVRDAEASIAVTAELLEAAGLGEAGAERLLALPVEELLAAQAVVSAAHTDALGLSYPFVPMIGGSVLPQHPLAAVASGVNAAADLVAGTMLNEGTLFTVLIQHPSIRGRSHGERLAELAAQDFGDAAPEAVREYRARLEASIGAEASDGRVLDSYISDRLYRQPTNRLLEARAGGPGRSFAYLFTWPSPVMDGALGAIHGLDISFVFRHLDQREGYSFVGDEPPEELSEWVSSAWAGFARTGAPAAPGLPDWPDYSDAERSTMILDTPPRIERDPLGPLREFWAAGARS